MRTPALSPRLALALTAFVGLLVLAVPDARAHTNLVASTPAAGASVDALDAVTLRFDAPVEVAQLHLWLELDGGYMAIGPAVPTGADADEVRVALPPIGAGAYALGWHLVAADGDAVTGSVPFTIGAGAPAPAVTQPAQTAARPAVAEVPPPPAARRLGDPLAIAALVGVSIGLALALARRAGTSGVPPLAALGIAGCVAIALAARLVPVLYVAGWIGALAALFAVAHPGIRRIRPKERFAR